MKNDDDDRQFALATAHAAVELDVAGVLGAILDGSFTVDESIGESTWRSETSQFFAVRWRFEGKHVGTIPGFGHTSIAATDNLVSVSGLTLLENTAPDDGAIEDLETLLRSGKVVFHRFIDWLAVFAQIGVLHLGRPMSLTDIRFVPPDRKMSRRPGYNDQLDDD
ncbi:MAG: hypothetical protein ACXV8K_03200 [Ilumatobacteraceae bacterium]